MSKHPIIFDTNQNYTATYDEGIAYYSNLAEAYDQISMTPFGMTDSGNPLHEVIISQDKDFDPVSIRKSGKTVLLINNAIHPGEPCGVEASMLLARDLVSDKKMKGLLNDVVVVIIPYYNISGALNRNSHTRANQEGPHEYGFRGNVRHLDLNRDFVKCDTKNAESFNKLIAKWKPEVMIDNHTSNGADYQYVMTLIATQKDQLNPFVSRYMTDVMLPELYASMKSKRYEMTPYVNVSKTPDDGIYGFMDLPRYSSGYAAMHNTISFMPEAHMLKPYKDRVLSTYDFSLSMLEHIQAHRAELMAARAKADDDTRMKSDFHLRYSLDYDSPEMMTFKGYEAKYKPSAVTGEPRLYYDRNSPYEKEIPYYNNYKPTLTVNKPNAYIFPQAFREVADRLRWNGVKVEQLQEDKVMTVQAYRIESYKDAKAYEGHYLHYDVEVSKSEQKLQFYKGDYIVYTNQVSNNYLVNALEPQHPDSYFAWNFMDGILMQKEYFSSYIFEDTAAKMLADDPALKAQFLKKKSEDEAFASNPREQLTWIYRQSPHYEKGHMRYPVFRLEQ